MKGLVNLLLTNCAVNAGLNLLIGSSNRISSSMADSICSNVERDMLLNSTPSACFITFVSAKWKSIKTTPEKCCNEVFVIATISFVYGITIKIAGFLQT